MKKNLIIAISILVLSLSFIDDIFMTSKYVNIYEYLEEKSIDVEKFFIRIKKSYYENQATENVKNYIQNKYGFTPTIIDSKFDYDIKEISTAYSSILIPNDQNFFKCEHNGKTFWVKVTGKVKSIVGEDNYQSDEIKSKIINTINEKIGIEPYNFDISYGNSYFISGNGITIDNLISEKLNESTDLNNTIFSLNILLEYAPEIDFSKYIQNNFFSFLPNDTKILMIKYKSLEDFNWANTLSKKEKEQSQKIESMNSLQDFLIQYGTSGYVNHSHKMSSNVFGHDLIEKALNISSILTVENNVIAIKELNIQEFDDIYILQLVDGYPFKLSNLDENEVENFYYSKGTEKTQAYKITFEKSGNKKNGNQLYLYFPFNKLIDFSTTYDNNIKLVLKYIDSEGKVVYEESSTSFNFDVEKAQTKDGSYLIIDFNPKYDDILEFNFILLSD